MKDTITKIYLFTSLSLSVSWSLFLPLSVALLSISLVVIAGGLQGFCCLLPAINVGTNKIPLYSSSATGVKSRAASTQAHIPTFTHTTTTTCTGQINFNLKFNLKVSAYRFHLCESLCVCVCVWWCNTGFSCIPACPLLILARISAGDKVVDGGL